MTVGTLKELNAKEGETFEVVCDTCDSHISQRYTVRDGLYGLKAYSIDRYPAYVNLECQWEFKRVRPVIESFGVEYENEWHLNQGQEIPEDAEVVEHNGSVVAYRLPKKPKVKVITREGYFETRDAYNLLYGRSEGSESEFPLRLTITLEDGKPISGTVEFV